MPESKGILSQLSIRKLFLLDCMGALVTTLLLALLVAPAVSTFGMPTRTVHVLAAIASLFFLYSGTCFMFLKQKWQPYLMGIAVVNSLYCVLSVALLITHSESVTPLGWIYFIGEVLIVLTLSYFELKVARGDIQLKF